MNRARVIASSLRLEADKRTQRARADRALARLARGDGPIVAGPWLGEVGFELLYWIPMLRWFRERFGVGPERLVAITRGGAGAWYEGLAGRTLEVLDHATPAELREWIGRPGSQKPRRPGDFEHLLLARFAPDIGAEGDHGLLHPGLMYDLFRLFWAKSRSRPLSDVTGRSLYAPLPATAGAQPVAGLPRDYVAFKAYFSPVFPDTPENRGFVATMLARLASEGEVVVLSTGIEIDDHADAAGAPAGRLHDLRELVNARDNLAVQTAVIRHARGLVTTYGGFSYLAPLVGGRSWSFSATGSQNPRHAEVMRHAMGALREAGLDPGFEVLSTEEMLSAPNAPPTPRA